LEPAEVLGAICKTTRENHIQHIIH